MTKRDKVVLIIIVILAIIGAVTGWRVGQLVLDSSTQIRSKDILSARAGLPVLFATFFGIFGFVLFGSNNRP